MGKWLLKPQISWTIRHMKAGFFIRYATKKVVLFMQVLDPSELTK
jgi:hypothetical protein